MVQPATIMANSMSAKVAAPSEDERQMIPVRVVHNYVYCPRLMYIQFVEGVFVTNADVVAGDATHRRVDVPSVAAYPDELLNGTRETLRSLALQDDELGLSGVADLLRRQEDGTWCLYDYKHGAPLTDETGQTRAWDTDTWQVIAYATLARRQGYQVSAGAVYYARTRQVLPITIPDDDTELSHLLDELRACAAGGMPPPRSQDMRCLRCSAYPVCLPNETLVWKHQQKATGGDAPPLAEREDGVALVVTSPQARLSKRGDTIAVVENDQVLASAPIHSLSSIAIYGTAQLSTQVLQMCLKEQIAVAFFSPAGSYMGRLDTLGLAGLDSRHGQYRLAENEPHAVKLAGQMIKAKIMNQRILLQRNARQRDKQLLDDLAELARQAVKATTRNELMGVEGRAAALYFGHFADMLAQPDFASLFSGRNRRPPRDPVNAMLSLGYSVLASEITGICHLVGLDPACGILHAPRYGRPALALDLMEEFRPLIVDSVVLSLVNRGAVDVSDFISASTGCALKKSGHQAFWTAYSRRMAEELIHPTFKYRMSYRRLLEVQTRQLWRIFRGDMNTYHPIVTR